MAKYLRPNMLIPHQSTTTSTNHNNNNNNNNDGDDEPWQHYPTGIHAHMSQRLSARSEVLFATDEIDLRIVDIRRDDGRETKTLLVLAERR